MTRIYPELQPLSFDAPLSGYAAQAAALLDAHASGVPWALRLFHERHPRFLDDSIPWLPKRIPDGEIRDAALDRSDAELAIARWYDFRDWSSLTGYVDAVSDPTNPVSFFEAAVEAVVDGRVADLISLLRDHHGLHEARSTRVTQFDPPVHAATLLHYLAANGVEGIRQRTPAAAVEAMRTLLAAGADPNALAGFYGGQCTTLTLLVSSSHPASAGQQLALTRTLIEGGATVEPCGEGQWRSPLLTALAFGFVDAARELVRYGAAVQTLPAAAGLGLFDEVRSLLPLAGAEARHCATALAAQLNHPEILRLLLDAGEDPNRFNPRGLHRHSTPLHQAVASGNFAIVRLLVSRGARLDIEDSIYRSTPLGWANHLGQNEIAEFLRAV